MSLDVLVRALEGGGNPYHKGAGPGGGQFTSGPGVSMRPLNTGANETWLVNDGSPNAKIFKVMNSEYPQESHHEVLAYHLGEMLGFANVPTTITAKNSGKQGTMQDFINGKTGLEVADNPKVMKALRPQMLQLAYFDYIMGQNDRWSKNWIVDQGGKLWAIDNGLASPLSASNSTYRINRNVFKGTSLDLPASVKARLGKITEQDVDKVVYHLPAQYRAEWKQGITERLSAVNKYGSRVFREPQLAYGGK